MIIKENINVFLSWLNKNGYAGYDPYDLWATPYGLWSRSVFYKNKYLGLPLVAPIALMDMFCPQVRALVVEKRRFAISDAHLILGFLNLGLLEEAKQLGRQLPASSVPGLAGRGYGYPFDWQNNRGLWKKGTPFITVSPYCFEALMKLFDLTGQEQFRVDAKSVVDFAYAGLNRTEITSDAWASSYSPLDHSRIVNASAYRGFVLAEASKRFSNEAYKHDAQKYVNFVLQAQRADGSWPYAEASQHDSFVDHFHTCFVLKNLYKANMVLEDTRVDDALKKGYTFYRTHLFEDDCPVPFYPQGRAGLVKYEMYDWAETIALGVLVKEHIPGAFDLSLSLAHKVGRLYQCADGHFATKVYKGNVKHSMAFIRWPQAQMFYALTQVLKTMEA